MNGLRIATGCVCRFIIRLMSCAGAYEVHCFHMVQHIASLEHFYLKNSVLTTVRVNNIPKVAVRDGNL
jgi:hypothetical protein